MRINGFAVIIQEPLDMTEQTDKKIYRILIIGGGGETGKTILRYISTRHDNVELTVAGRHEPSGKEEYRYVRINLKDFTGSVTLVREFDLVIAACGPMEKVLSGLLNICIEAGVDVIDINDSAKAASDVLDKHAYAADRNVRIYSGMGMSPGLTSLMLRTLAEKKMSAEGVYRARISMGTAYGGGRSSPYAMLDNLKNDILVYQNSRAVVIRNPWRDDKSDFLFMGKRKKLTGVHYSTPEIYSLASPRYPHDRAFVSCYDIRCTMEGFPVWAAGLIARINGSGRFNDVLAGMFYKSGQKMKGNAKSDPDNHIVVYPDSDEDRGIMLFGDVSSYDLTAAMAAAVTDCWIDGSLSEKPGVYSVEFLNDDSFAAVVRALDRRNIFWKNVADVRRSGWDQWGWLERNAHDVSSLRHYGENWYTVRIHPRMKNVQTDILYASGVWKEVRSRCKGLSFVLCVLKMMNRWRRNMSSLKKEGKKDAVHLALVKDMSMFASGYSLVRDMVGVDKAVELYKDMFLTAGNSEMCWFMPRPETFMRLAKPAESVITYFKAMMDKNDACGFVSFKYGKELNEGRTEIRFEIRNCIYAGIFKRLGCPELCDLIRLEEMLELARITKGTGISYDYELLGGGDANIVFSFTQDARK